MTHRSELAGQPLELESPVEGVSFRRFAGESDFAPMAAILMATSQADGGDRYETPERLAAAYANLYNCDPYLDMIIAVSASDVIGYSRVFWQDEIDGPRSYGAFGWLHPTFRTRGIGTVMYEANEMRIRDIAAQHEPNMDKVVTSVVAESDRSGVRLLEKHDFTPDGYIADMVRPNLDDIPTAPMPDGLTVRTPTPAEYRKVWEAAQEAFMDHHGASQPQETWYQEFLDDPNFDPELWRVAWDDDEVAGMVRSFIDPEQNELYGRLRGWTEDISTRRPYRRRGLARALLCQSLEAVRRAGMTEAALAVHTENPLGAFRLYESVGFRVVRQDVWFKKPLDDPQ